MFNIRIINSSIETQYKIRIINRNMIMNKLCIYVVDLNNSYIGIRYTIVSH